MRGFHSNKPLASQIIASPLTGPTLPYEACIHAPLLIVCLPVSSLTSTSQSTSNMWSENTLPNTSWSLATLGCDVTVGPHTTPR